MVFSDFEYSGGPGFPAGPNPSVRVRGPTTKPAKTHSFFHHFFGVFLDRFLFDLGSSFPPTLPPKTHQNR